jgi:hypothetical protein
VLSVARVVFPVTPAASEEEKTETTEKTEARPLSSIERDLQSAIAAKAYGQAEALLDELAALGGPKAYRVIIKHALSGNDVDSEAHKMERRAAGLLASVEDLEVHAEVFKEVETNPNYKTRIILLAVASALARETEGRSPALDAVHAGLKDRMDPVVLASLQWLRKLKRNESVDVLIAHLERREKRAHDRIYFDVRGALAAITGQSFPVAADWKSFWEAYKENRAPKERKGGVTELYRPKFFSVTLDSDKVFFIIDVSGSMEIRDPELPPEEEPQDADPGVKPGTTVVVEKKPDPGTEVTRRPPPPPPSIERARIERAKKELREVIRHLPESTRFGILAYSHELRFWQEARTLRDAGPRNKQDALEWVDNLKAAGATLTDRALFEVLAIPEVDTILLLTDGAPRDERNNLLAIEPILEGVRLANRFRKCRIHTLSFEAIKDREMRAFVRELAESNDGTSTFVK